MINSIKIAHHNIRGITNKLTSLKLFIQQHKPHIITFNETLLKTRKKFIIPGYTLSFPKEIIGRGVAIAYLNSIKNVEELEQIKTTNQTDNIHHSILINTEDKQQFQITTIYCPKKNPSAEIIDKVSKRYKNTIITGDFNSRHENLGHEKADKHGNTLIKITEKNELTKLNDNQPTYTDDRSGKQDVKDIIFSSKSMTSKFIEFTVEEDLGSDHNIITATFKNTNITTHSPKKTIYIYHKADWNHINKTITATMNLSTLNHKSTTVDIENYTKNLTKAINTTINDNVKTIELKENSIGISDHIKKLIKEKRQLRNQWKKTRNKNDKTNYNHLNNIVKQTIYREKRQKWEQKCNDLELTENQDNQWQQLKILTNTKTQTTFPTLITKDNKGNEIKSQTTKEKVKTLTTALENIFTKEGNQDNYNNQFKEHVENEIINISHLIRPLKQIPTNYMKQNNAITNEEITHTINKSKNKKAPGKDKITNKLLKLLKPSLIPILTNLYNICYIKGYHPKHWKETKIILLNKPDKPKSNPSNYRPISLINTISKTLEKIIKTKLYKWAETNNKLNKEQAGFRQNKSTNDKIFELTQIAIQAKNRKRYTAAIFLDIEKAFDKIWHNGLIYKLHNINTPPTLLRYLNSFIKNRTIHFNILNETSKQIKLNTGVPQGSSLSPLLFILYVADLPPINNNTHRSQFADDIKIYGSHKNINKLHDKLQPTINSLLEYAAKWRIGLNANKTNELIFGYRKPKITNSNKLNINNQEIKITEKAKFLGITFDKNLTFKQHIKITNNKAYIRTTKLKSIYNKHHGPSEKTMIRLYKIFVRPLFEYGTTATTTASKNTLKTWEKTQAHFVKYILNEHSISHKNLNKYANLPTIKDRNNNLLMKWFEKSITNNPSIQNFIEEHVKDFESFDKYKSPYRIIREINNNINHITTNHN